MNAQIHGHEIINMMLESNAPYTADSLRDAIHSRFGETTRFHTCSAENLSADELILFLANRGKFSPVEGGFRIDVGRACGSDHSD